MAISAADILRTITQMVAAGAFGGGAGFAGVPLSVVTGSVGGTQIPASASTFLAKNYPTEFAPDANHNYDVVYAPRPDGEKGPYANNNFLGKKNSDTIDRAGIMQTQKEHNDALLHYYNMLSPVDRKDPRKVRAALDHGRDFEKGLDAFWNESKSRRDFQVSSSAVKGIRLTPDGRIQVKWGKPSKKNPSGWYTFKQYPNTYEASKAAQALLKSDSIGRAVYPVVSNPPKKMSPGLGEWNAVNFAPEYG